MPTKILVADDSATMRRVLEMTFAGEDAQVHTADSAEAALAKAAELSPDVVFADASMPGVDGYELARRIKNNPQLAKIAVIVLSSQQAPYDEGKGKNAGVDDHVSKPFDTQALIDRVGQVLARGRAAPSGDAPKAAAASAAAPAARPAPPAPAAAAAAPNRMPQGGTRMGMGGPVPLQPTASKPPAPQPIPALRPATPPLTPVAAPAKQPPAPLARPAAASSPAGASAAMQVATQDLSAKLAHLGLNREQLEGVLALSREVIEQVVWEVVPELAETLIKEEIRRLTAE
ncbi:MAG: Translation initiation factor 2 [Myxococcaceae bacterium]|nr:Translation initiation factor 2 [Myxococcaceae bacterium]